ncbi:hypothetical protein TSAR_006344 [Trichomalopsis sarcophagae]|uniref:Uncharacterized protein n=1 Tax=Trichomalopsis sarcophagae TaxID=543379 RepID=A0A232FLC4_9HYME|nr:hypothetical protein TSAR_006344 [Trichomalopsis sarcophagae]
MEEVGDQALIKLMYECKRGAELAEIKDRLERGIRIKLEQEIQRDWEKIEKSNYCPEYKNWKDDLGKERYWENKEISGFVKEQWARMRYGNIGYLGKKRKLRVTFGAVSKREKKNRGGIDKGSG